MNFSEWCFSKQIRGNFQDALYHSLAAKFGRDKIESVGEDEWAKEWSIVLREFMAVALSVNDPQHRPR